jgi:hypothetical protein
MNVPTPEEQRELVQQWEETGRELERMRRKALRGLAYNWEDVDALLELGDHYDGPPRLDSGLVEMQRWFMTHPLCRDSASSARTPNSQAHNTGRVKGPDENNP